MAYRKLWEAMFSMCMMTSFHSSDYNSYRKWAGLTDLMDLGILPCYECCETSVPNLMRCEKTTQPSCASCLEKRAADVRNNIINSPKEIDVEDFIVLGEAYYWFLDLIDPFPG